MRRNGFTLSEMVVIVAILAILAGAGYPMLMSMMGRARENACLGNLRAIGSGVEVYLKDHGDRMPELKAARSSKTEDVPVMDVALLEYIGSPKIFHCPADGKQFRKTGSSYLWNSTQNGRMVNELSFFGIRTDDSRIPLVTDKEAWHPGGTNILYADFSASNKIRFGTSKR